MRSVMAFVYFLLSLVGLAGGTGGGGTTLVARSAENGVDTLLSSTHVADGKVRFQCLRSASGHCHYVLFADRRPAGAFDVAVGQARERNDLPADFSLCVSHLDTDVDAQCRPAR
ncbi:MAG: hypothetical protein ABW002_11885 [Xanthomonas sp.]|jgi:hypothetical protein|uniref:hypothetical protein n=1 Tax=Lysobacter sp. GCM10012299 TaxID=3317333 RepID=UPI00347533F7